MGKRKIEIKKIENKSSKWVTFSKRRKGLFKKAAELCTLCDTQIAIVAFSPAGTPYSFGHPSAMAVIDGYLKGEPPTPIIDPVQQIKNQDWRGQVEVEGNQSVEELQRLIKELEEVRCRVLNREEVAKRVSVDDRFMGCNKDSDCERSLIFSEFPSLDDPFMGCNGDFVRERSSIYSSLDDSFMGFNRDFAQESNLIFSELDSHLDDYSFMGCDEDSDYKTSLILSELLPLDDGDYRF